MWSYIRNNQPVHWTGAVQHSLRWLFYATCSDAIIRNPNYAGQADDGIVIYCVHGTADRNSSFGLLAQRILPYLPETISSIHLVSFQDLCPANNSIEVFAQSLLNKIVTNQHKKVILMGHSRGGRIIISLAEELAASAGIEILALFPVCTPVCGTDIYVPLITPYFLSLAQMMRNHPHTKKTMEQVTNSPFKYFFYGAANDALVKPQDATVGNHPTTILARHGHLSIMSSHQLVNDIKADIDRILAPENAINSLAEPENDGSFIVITEAENGTYIMLDDLSTLPDVDAAEHSQFHP